MRTQCRYTFCADDGATICLDSGNPDQPVVLYYGRDNAAADASFANAILAALRDRGWRVAEYDTADRVIGRILDPHQRLARCSTWRRRALKIVLLIQKPKLWRHYLCQQMLGKEYHTRRSMIRCVKTSGICPDVVLGYSAGARFSAATADGLKLKGLVCLGYPFRYPKHHDEPSRYRHLATLRTPCLILQGQKDEYGGRADISRYPLSNAIEIRFWDTDHNFKLGERDRNDAIAVVMDFLRAHGIDRHG